MNIENKDSTIKLDIGKFFPNLQTKISFTIFFISLLISILSYFKISFGVDSFGQFLSVFPGLLLWTLTLSLAISTACAYFGKFKWMFLSLIIWILLATFIVRTANVPQLKDVTTGDWTLAPDLDPFLYLRHAQEINSGTLENPDKMRYFPVGSKNYAYQNLMPWFIFYFYKISQIFGNDSLTYAAIMLPVILFGISAIGFLLFVKVLSSLKFSESKSWVYAIISSVFYIFMPAMLHRTVAGVPEIESLGMIWFWFAFLFITLAWKEENTKKIILYGIASGVLTGLMSWSWGGYRYIYMIFGLATLLLFFFRKNERKNRIIFTSWVIPSLIIIFPQIKNIKFIMTSLSDTGFGLFILLLLWINFLLFETRFKEKIKIEKINLPKPVASLIIEILFLVLILLVVDSSLLISSAKDIFERLQYPFGRARVGLTVAENASPYFLQIVQNFGYLIWVFVAGTFVVFYEVVKKFSLKNKIILNGFFILFIFGFVLSKYSPSGILNGESLISKIFYMGSLFAFILALLYVLIKAHINKDEKTLKDFAEIDFMHILLLSFAFWGIVSMRGAIRLLFIISPMIPLISGFLFVQILNYREKNKDDDIKKLSSLIAFSVLTIILIATFFSYSTETIYSARGTVPGVYEHQWQNAMSWVRENTQENSVFVHWWDYGYWVQTIGKRATVADGGHSISYWPHLIGRYVLTTKQPETALSFMKTHDVSYLLIDSTDLGKYTAYSKIGSDENGSDRYTQLTIISVDPSQTQEDSNGTTRLYRGGVYLDQDIIYGGGENGIFLPEGKAIFGGVILKEFQKGNDISFSQPIGVFLYNNKQVPLPLKYLYYNGEIMDFGSGINSVFRIIPVATQNNNQVQMDNLGAGIYISPKASDGLFVQLYLLDDPYGRYGTVKLAHAEQDPIITELNAQGAGIKDFLFFNGFRGPIKIWKVDYPQNIIAREEFLRTDGSYAEFDNLTFTN